MSSESEMTKETSSGSTPLGVFYRYPRLIQGLSLFSGLGLISSGLVVAQTQSPIDNTGMAPPKAAVAPAAHWAPPPEPAAPMREVVPPKVISAPEASWERTPPAPVREREPIVERQAPAPVREREPIVERQPTLAPPNLSVPDAPAIAKPPKLYVNPAQIQESAKSPIPATNSYIDRTDYSLGATPPSEAPDRVVLTERSTGCSAVSQNGQLSSGVCNVALPTPATVSKPIAMIANQPTATQPTPNSGRTIPELRLNGVPRLPTPPKVGSVPVNLGPLRLSPNTPGGTASTVYPTYSSYPVASGSPNYSTYSGSSPVLPSSLAYYNLTRRPQQRLNLGKTSFMFPLTIPSEITSVFGWRIHPISGDQRFHSGTDLGAPEGTPVLAAVAGQVVTADVVGGYGLTVILQHEKGTQESLYAHLSQIFVKPGDMVEQGNVIGRVGSTGNSTGPHLHFEWRHLTPDGWVAVDAGAHLQYSLAQFVRALQLAQSIPQRGN